MEDLVLLVADKQMQFTLRGALSRPESLGIRPVSYEFRVHPYRDGGTRTDGATVLSLERTQFSHAMLMLDFEGSGSSELNAVALEQSLDNQLRENWGDRAKSIVIEPELDIWMWGSDNVLQNILGRPDEAGIREWLIGQGFHFTGAGKPTRPKEAMEKLVKKLRRPRSASTYESIAREISLTRCTDPAFIRLRDTLQRWFPVG